MNSASTKNGSRLRDTGLEAVGPVPWGSHFCIFYETRKDLCEIVGPYFKAGLENNEFCIWYVGSHEFHAVKDARGVLREQIPQVERLEAKGQIEIAPRQRWFWRNGRIDTARSLAHDQKQIDLALRRGFSGVRLHGSPAWLRVNLGESGFCRYERTLTSHLAGQPIIIACTFPLLLTGAEQILDAARLHQFAVTLRHGVWRRVEIRNMASARREAIRATPSLEQLTYRQREILQLIAEGENTKQIARLLGISAKTVEAHRLQLMRRLKIDNVPGLVRFAIGTGLVSVAA